MTGVCKWQWSLSGSVRESLATIQVLVFCKVIWGVISNNSTVFAGEPELSSSEFCIWLLVSLQVSAILCDSTPQLQWLLEFIRPFRYAYRPPPPFDLSSKGCLPDFPSFSCFFPPVFTFFVICSSFTTRGLHEDMSRHLFNSPVQSSGWSRVV